jgi:Ca2+-binding EF-hand superfamily protein
LRACGQNPTLAEISDLEASVGADCKFPASHRPSFFLPFTTMSSLQSHAILWLLFYAHGLSLVDFDLFLRILNRPDGFRNPGQPEDFVRGFQVFDKDGTGFIGVGELKYGIPAPIFFSPFSNFKTVLTSLGEKLSDDEVEELLKGINIGKDGSINYSGISVMKSSSLINQNLFK